MAQNLPIINLHVFFFWTFSDLFQYQPNFPDLSANGKDLLCTYLEKSPFLSAF